MARSTEVRSIAMKVTLTPEVHARVKAAAAEVGVSASTWIAFRVGEAVNAQERTGHIFDSFGSVLADRIAAADEEHERGAND